MGWWTADRQRYAAQYLMSGAALSAFGAAGLVSRWVNVESSGGPASRNPSSGAFGIGQWLGSRLTPIKGNTSFDAQLAYAVRELNGTEQRAGDALRVAQTVDEAARGASMYERAEGYNAATGRDNWTTKTANGIPAVYAIINGSIPIQQTADSGSPASLPTSDPFASIGQDWLDETGLTAVGLSAGALLGIGASLLLIYFLWD